MLLKFVMLAVLKNISLFQFLIKVNADRRKWDAGFANSLFVVKSSVTIS